MGREEVIQRNLELLGRGIEGRFELFGVEKKSEYLWWPQEIGRASCRERVFRAV